MDFYIRILLYTIDIFIIYQLCHGFIERKPNYTIKNLIFFLLIGITHSTLVHFFHTSDIKFIIYFNSFFLIWFISNKTLQETLILFSLIMCIVFSLQLLIYGFTYIFSLTNLTAITILGQITSLIFVIFISKLPLFHILKKFEKNIVLNLFFFIIAIAYLIYFHKDFSLNKVPYNFYFVFIFIITILGGYQSLKKIVFYTEKYPAIHHDTTNIFLSLYYSMNENFEPTNMKKSLNECFELLNIHTNNSLEDFSNIPKIIRSFVNHKQSLQNKKVKINCEIHYFENNSVIPLTSILCMLGILLDNAIEASPPKKEINVYILCGEHNLDIKVSNYFLGTIDLTTILQPKYTTKKNHSGYGLANLEQMIDKYNGHKFIKQSNNTITLGVEIDNFN